MADITSLGIVIDAGDIKRAIEALNKLQQASKEAEKNTKALGETADSSAKKVKDGADQATLALQREARAQRAAEQAALAKEKTATQTAKTAAINASTAEKALNQEAARIRAATRLEEGLARQRDESAKRLDLIGTKQAQAAALQSKYTSQAQAIQERASAYTLNQQSLIEQRALKTQNSITASAQRAALMQEKFEFQKAQAAERAARRSTGAWSSFRDALSTLSDATVGGFGISALVDKAGGVVRTADEMTLLDARLKLATKSSAEFAQAQYNLRQSSVENGLAIAGQTSTYTQLERSTRGLKLSVSDLSFLTESFGKAAVVSGADAESFKSAITQLNQGFASGVIRGQEFNSAAEQSPVILEAMVAGMRGTNKEFDELEKKGLLGVAALRKMAGEGKLVNSVTIPALLEGLKKTNEEFDKMPLTVERAFTMVQNKYKIWISDQNNAAGATKTFAESLKLLAANFDTVVSGLLLGAGAIATLLTGRFVSSIVTSEKAVSALSAVTGKYASESKLAALSALDAAKSEQNLAKQEVERLKNAPKLAHNVIAMTQAQGALAAATDNVTKQQVAYNNVLKATTPLAVAAKASVSAFGAVLNVFGGWVGVAVTGLTLLATHWITVGDAAKQAADKAVDAANKIKIALAQGNKVLAENTRTGLAKEYEGAAAQLANLHKQEADLRKQMALRKADENALINPAVSRREGGATFGEALGTIRARIASTSGVVGAFRDQLQGIDATIRDFNSDEALNRIKVDVVTPTLDGKKPKAPPLLGAGDNDVIRAKAALATLQEEIDLANKLGTAKDNLNEHEKRAEVIKIKLGKLREDAKNYDEAKANLEAALAIEKQAGAAQRELDTIQKRNQAILDWEKATDKVIEKQEDLAKYTAVDLGGKTETAQEASARRTKENYEAALRTLKAVDEVLGAPEGVSDTKKRQKLALVMDIKPVKAAANFEDQVAGLDKGIAEATRTGDLDVVEKLEKDKTAIIEEQTRQRNELREKESALLQENLSKAQSVTGSFLDVLKNAGQEQSGIYKALFAVDKAFAIAKSIVAIQTAMASASMSLPFPGNLGAIATVASATAGIVSTISSTDLKFAKGGVFDGPVGSGSGVVSTPTTFPMSGGRTGLMGEKAGSPEAILPLSRDANGRLGVNLNGGISGGNSNVQQNNIQITVNGGSTNEETAGVISRELLKTMERIADSRINNAKRPNGILTR